MYVALLVGPAALLVLTAWLVYRHQPRSRLFALAIFCAVGFWYLLPGTLFLLGGEVASADSDLLQAHSEIETAIALIHGSLALLLILPGLFSAMPRQFLGASTSASVTAETANHTRLDILLLLMITSSVAFLISRYAELGPAFALQLLLGLTSAREVMTFENFSSGPGQSLLALWEIVTIFLSVFLATVFVWQRRTLSIRFVGACLAVLLAFVSSGSRTVLLLLLFAVAISLVGRPSRQAERKSGQRRRRWAGRGVLPLILMIGLTTVAATVMLARFQDDPSQSEALALNTVGSHNDMFRELVYVIKHGGNYHSDAWLFLQTPLTYAMPTFLGFNKSIPPHLVDFNFDRAGIDIVSGEGNVFPGLIGDMVMCFGLFGPVVLWAVSAVIFFIMLFVCGRSQSRTISSALLVTLLCYYVVSFRNMQGAFAILVTLAAVVSAWLPRKPSNSNYNRIFTSIMPLKSSSTKPIYPPGKPADAIL